MLTSAGKTATSQTKHFFPAQNKGNGPRVSGGGEFAPHCLFDFNFPGYEPFCMVYMRALLMS